MANLDDGLKGAEVGLDKGLGQNNLILEDIIEYAE